MVTTVFLALALIAILGSLLRYFMPHFDIDTARKNLSALVLAVFLPALNFKVIYHAKLDAQFWKIPLIIIAIAACGIIVSALIYSLYKRTTWNKKGTLISGASFSNVTYLGIPVLKSLFPSAINDVLKTAILSEMVLTPMNLIAGSAIANACKKDTKFSLSQTLLQVIKLPLIWAIVIAVVFNALHIPVPNFIMKAVNLLAEVVSGLMILVLGMALNYKVLKKLSESIWLIIPMIVIKLALLPFTAYWLTQFITLPAPFHVATILETAMPPQLISFIVADRFNLDTSLLAVATFICTALSFLTLPWLFHLLQ